MTLLGCTFPNKLHAGGSGLNTVVIVNQASSNSCELGNYYCQQRGIPPQNVLFINWPGGNIVWASNDFQSVLVTPLLQMLGSNQLTNQIQYVVLSMDIPFETTFGSINNGTTAALFYGLRQGDGTDPSGLTNSYAASEAAFPEAMPIGALGYSFLTTMITGDSLAHAKQLVDQGVASDGTFPRQPVILAKSSDVLRNLRYQYFDNAIFNVNILGVSTILRTNTDSIQWLNGCMGYQTGLADFSVPQGLFVPGSMADSLTSYGGQIFGNNSQSNLLGFIDVGAAGSYGTVSEPDDDTQKFPNPQVYFYQARGFSLAESYYQSLNVPYLGLVVAEPLATPFAHPGFGAWSGTNIANAVLSGKTNLSVRFTAYDTRHPLQQVDLFVDGVYYSTLTNLPPTPGNQLTVSLNGYPISYTVPTNSTRATVAAGLATAINAATNATQVKAMLHGDRVELQCISGNPMDVPFYITNAASAGGSGVSYNVSYLNASFSPPIVAGPPDKRGNFTMKVGIPAAEAYVVQASTNLIDWQPIFTNSTPGWLNFTDNASASYPMRFYRMAWPGSIQPPQLTGPGFLGGGTFRMHVNGVVGQPWAIQTTADLVHWTTVFTNQSGGLMDFVDASATNSFRRFYRAWLVPPVPPSVTVMNAASNLTLVQVTNALLPYTVGVSTNQGQWTAIETNFNFAEIQTSATSAIGTGHSLTTFLSASQPVFMASQALGMQGYLVISNPAPTNAWIRFTFTKTNGQVVVVGVTNQAGGDSSALTSLLLSTINSNADLQGSDGVLADDFVPGSITFNLYARSAGFQAAAIQVSNNASRVYMSVLHSSLRQNVSDLEPRNHLYVTAGASVLPVSFTLDTTTLSDGYHNLTAVAYEGSEARTQTQASAPIQIQNSSLSATLTPLDVTNSAPVPGTYHFQVAANTNNVSLITLFSTGGAVGAATNQSTATFQVVGTNLWAGLHPFYAIVQTSGGLSYRTQTQWIQLVSGP